MAGDWPTQADIYRAVLATREDSAATRADVRVLCERLDAQAGALAQHRADDRRELDDHQHRLDGLSRWRWSTVGGVAVLVAVVLPLLLETLGRTAG